MVDEIRMKTRIKTTVARSLAILTLLLLNSQVPYSAQDAKEDDSKGMASNKTMPFLQPEAVDLLKKVSAAYKNLKQFQLEVDVNTRMNSPLRQKSSETHISLTAIRPGKMKLILQNAAGQIQYFRNGTTAITYLPRLNQYIQRPVELPNRPPSDEDEPGAFDFATTGDQIVSQYESIDEGVTTARMLREEALDLGQEKINCVVIEIEASKHHEEGEATQKRTYWIDKTSNLVRKAESENRFQPESKEEATVLNTEKIFSVFKTLEPIDDEIFKFLPPSGAKEVAEFLEPSQRAENPYGKEAPDFTLKTFKGATVQMKKLRGKVVLLSFWASWCGPCRHEMPVIEKLSHQYRDQGFLVFGVNDEDRDTIQDYIKENGYSFPTLVDEEQEAMKLYHVGAIPTTVVIDREGKIASYQVGTSSENELRAVLRTLGIH
jgi:peroxiredoxin/outer membrane lipoprotein-sorting protein